MQRRQFIRLCAAGAAGASAVPLAGCSSEIPAEAVAAWRGPGAETDLRRWVLAHAILAPHSHNLQSWRVELRGSDELVLHVDLERLLPETDPFGRQITMSQGTFLELLDIAARERGQRAEITLFPDGAYGPDKPDARALAHVRLVPDATVRKDPLFAQILHRHTNRNAYAPERPVAAEAWSAMQQAAAPYPLRFAFVAADDAAALQQHRRIAADAWRIELTTPRTVMESYRVLRIGASEIARHRDGIALTEPAVVWLDRFGLFDRSRAPAPDDYATTSQLEQFGRKLDSTPAFLWMVSAANDRVTQVLAGRAYARVQLAATAHGVAMQPLQQALQEYPEQGGPYAAIRRQVGAEAPGQTVQMWARVGYAAPVPPAPRRGVDAILQA